MFFDLVGSTTLSGQLDPEELRDLVQTYQEVCNEVVARYQGHVAQYLGDGILVYFGFPKAHPDDGQRAVGSALSIIAAMARLNQRLESESRPRLDLRVGIHTGLVVVGEMGSREHREHLALGETPNVAARLQGLAGINEVVFSAATRALVQDEFELEDRGLHSLKGVAEPVPVYRAVGWAQAETRRQLRRQRRLAVPLVGRERELSHLRLAWERASSGQGGALHLLGEPGIGKSRLAQALKDELRPTGAFLLSCYCQREESTSPFSGMAALVRRQLEFFSPQLAPVEKLASLVGGAELDPLVALPPLCDLLGLEPPGNEPAESLSPQSKRGRLLSTLNQLFLGLAAQRPLLLHVDGFEWLDPTSQECLLQLAERAQNSRILMLLVSRQWSQNEVEQLWLERLDEQASLQLVDSLLVDLNRDSSQAYQPDLNQVLERGHGVPLYLTELTRAAWTRRGLSGLPEQLHEFLMARVDELGPARLTAQQAATIGHRFSRSLVSALAECEANSHVDRLIQEGMVLARAHTGELFFVQNLMREACYDSLLKSVRQRYHLRLAQIFEQQFPLWAEQNPGVVAHHYLHSSQSAQAAPWLHRSLLRSLANCALTEAIETSREGLLLLDRLPADHSAQGLRLAFLSLQGGAWIGLRGYASVEVEQTFEKARELCREWGDGPQVFPVLAGLWALYLVQGRLRKAMDLSLRLLDLSQQHSDWARIARATHGQTCFFSGLFQSAQVSLREAVALYRPEQARGEALSYLLTEPSIASCSYLAYNCLLLGEEAEALRLSHQARHWAEQLRHPHTTAHTYAFEAWLLLSLSRYEEARQLSEELLQLARLQSFPLWSSMAEVYCGLCRLNLGDSGGAEQFQRGLEAGAATGAKLGTTWMLASLAQVLAAGGHLQQAQAVLEQALSHQEERWYWPELLRLKAQLSAQSEEAEVLRAEARRLAGEQRALWFLKSL